MAGIDEIAIGQLTMDSDESFGEKRFLFVVGNSKKSNRFDFSLIKKYLSFIYTSRLSYNSDDMTCA